MKPEPCPRLIDFFEAGTKLSYRKGEAIIRPSDEPNGIYYIKSGFVRAYTITKYGEENSLIIRHKGEIFPMIWAFTGDHRDVTYESMCESIILRQSRDAYIDFLTKNPDATRSVLDMAIEMYRVHSERVNNLSYRTVRERIISFLLISCERFGKVQKNGVVLIDAPIRHHDIASSISTTRETATRELNSLIRKGLIKNNHQRIYVIDKQALKNLLSD